MLYKVSQYKCPHLDFLPISQKLFGILTQNFTYLFSVSIYICLSNKILLTLNYDKITEFLGWHLMIFMHSKMCALLCHNYELNTINGLVFHYEIFHIYSVLNYKFTTWSVEFDYFQEWRSYRHFSMTHLSIFTQRKMFMENLPLCKKITWTPNNINKASDSAFTVNVHCVYPRLQHNLVYKVALQTHEMPELAFCCQLRHELTYVSFLLLDCTLLFRLLP